MQQFITSIRTSVTSKNWFGALFMALTMPDICGALEYGEARQVGIRYRNWFDNYLKPEYDPQPMSLDDYITKVNTSKYSSPATPEELLGLRSEFMVCYEQYLSKKQADAFTSSDCYKLRCKSLHQGVSEKAGEKKIAFSPPPETGLSIHRTNLKETYFIDIAVFCEDMCQAVERWVTASTSNIAIQQGIASLMTLESYNEFFTIIED